MNHFLDLNKTAPGELKSILSQAQDMKDARNGLPKATPDAEPTYEMTSGGLVWPDEVPRELHLQLLRVLEVVQAALPQR